MRTISIKEAAIHKFLEEYNSVEYIFNGMPMPKESQLTIEEIGKYKFKISAPGKFGVFVSTIDVDPVLDCYLLPCPLTDALDWWDSLSPIEKTNVCTLTTEEECNNWWLHLTSSEKTETHRAMVGTSQSIRVIDRRKRFK